MNIMLQLCEGEFLKMTHLQFLPFLRRLGVPNCELNKKAPLPQNLPLPLQQEK